MMYLSVDAPTAPSGVNSSARELSEGRPSAATRRGRHFIPLVSCAVAVFQLALVLYGNIGVATDTRNAGPAIATWATSNHGPAIATRSWIRNKTSQRLLARNITVGVVANEFFDPQVSRTGGFGMSTKMIGEFFKSHPELGVRIVFIYASPSQSYKQSSIRRGGPFYVWGWPLITIDSDAQFKKTRFDFFLTIDYRTDYRKVLNTYQGGQAAATPVIIWARDPRTRQQIFNIENIRLPAEPDLVPAGCGSALATDAGVLFNQSSSRRIAIGVTWLQALRDRLWEAYLIPLVGNVFSLPNILDYIEPVGTKASHPTVIFLARLDPYKRPWLMFELAKAFPHVQFLVVGRSHFEGRGSYQVDFGQFPNVRSFQHMDGLEKARMLTEAWFLVSTSAHEGVAISYLEALKCETPLLGMVDPGGLVSEYGIFAGEFGGTGLNGLNALKRGFQHLLTNHELRARLGRAGRQHVLATHSGEHFFNAFVVLAEHVGIATVLREEGELQEATSPSKRAGAEIP